MEYECGGIGQSGVGTVFYASTIPFSCVANGVDLTSSCNYLEVAPNGWNGDLVDCNGCGGSPDKTSDWGQSGIGTGRGYAYCTGMGDKNQIPNASGTDIGSGYANTTAMVQNCKPGDAGDQVRKYQGGGMTDWSLPSLDELNALAYYPNRNAIGGFAAAVYWSSTQFGAYTTDCKDAKGCGSYNEKFDNGKKQMTAYKDKQFGIRAIRAF